MPVGRQGNPVNSQQLQLKSGEGVTAHNQMWIIITNTREVPHRKKRESQSLTYGSGRFFLLMLLKKHHSLLRRRLHS